LKAAAAFKPPSGRITEPSDFHVASLSYPDGLAVHLAPWLAPWPVSVETVAATRRLESGKRRANAQARHAGVSWPLCKRIRVDRWPIFSFSRSGEYLDFTIKCGPHSFLDHKAIRCPRPVHYLSACLRYKSASLQDISYTPLQRKDMLECSVCSVSSSKQEQGDDDKFPLEHNLIVSIDW